ncbi:hypothetical protein EUGRSUZ_K02945 [Eucalyptus grandis]|uniref:Uncharacterized protein n=2 Tax=Eucalyptus grandis TaxID=71139 RepID=A0ACC3IYK3_EUCGR|nr:hypothetical protein EUGRSUZ_K02945 [Eucalyptus grandis]
MTTPHFRNLKLEHCNMCRLGLSKSSNSPILYISSSSRDHLTSSILLILDTNPMNHMPILSTPSTTVYAKYVQLLCPTQVKINFSKSPTFINK